VAICLTGGGGSQVPRAANQRVVIAGASQAGLARLEDVANVDYINWWGLGAWINGVRGQILTRPGVVGTVGFWFCANSYRRDYVRNDGGPADGILVPGQSQNWGTYSVGIENAVNDLLAAGFSVVLATTNTTTLAPGRPEPITQNTQDNIYAWNDFVRCFALNLKSQYPTRVALFDIAALTSTAVNGTLRVEYADSDQYHLNGTAYQDVLRPQLGLVLDSVGVDVTYPRITPWSTGWWNQGARFW
jgi:hypothetical protein